MGGEEDAAAAGGGRKIFWRSASWSSSRTSGSDVAGEKSSENGQIRRCPAPPLTPRSQNSKARSCLPPLQPLAIARRSFDEWPKAGSDDVGEWHQPPTPGAKPAGSNKPGEGLKVDLPSIHTQCEKDQIAFFDKECSKVADHIYLGGDSVARNREILKENGITHVLNCVGFVCPEYFKSDLVYKTLWLQDSPSEDITSILYDVFDYFEDVREQGGRVFVHCCQGVSRSTSLVIAYLMWRKGQSFDDAFQFVKAARGIANPNVGFACQLLLCQKRVHAIPLSPNSVLRLYRMAPHSSYDALHLVPKMLNDPSPAALDSRGAFILHVLSSIYVWLGKDCEPVMEKDAKAAAFQVVRYEKVQGSIVTVLEGEEPAAFWEAFSSVPISSDNATNAKKEQIESSTKISVGKRRVESYDADFELFRKAITGGVVPPFPSSGPGQETRLPARESNWSILRRKVVCGAISRVFPDSSLVRDSDPRVSRVQRLSSELLTSPPYLSPSSLSSDSSSSSKCSSESPSISPSTSPSTSLTPSPASSSLPDTSLPATKLFRFSNTFGRSDPCLESGPSPSKGPAKSIAERRGSFSLLKLPTLTRKLANSSHPSVANPQEFAENSGFSYGVNYGDSSPHCGNDYLEPQDVGPLHDTQTISRNTVLNDTCPVSSNTSKFLVYRWPNIESITTFDKKDLDSKALFFFLISDASRIGELGKMLYMWIGKSFKQADLRIQSNSGKDVDEANAIDWNQVGYDFLSLLGLPQDIPVRVCNTMPIPLIVLLSIRFIYCFCTSRSFIMCN